MTLPIPPDLLTHPTINHHPEVSALHEKYGGVPEDTDPETLERVLVFANAVANHAIEPGTKSRRADPSPRRSARIWRAELLGRDASVSPEREKDAQSQVQQQFRSLSLSPARVRYRSRSRQPTTGTVREVKEEEGEGDGDQLRGQTRTPGRRDLPDTSGSSAHTQLEHRVNTIVQQQHEFHDRLLRRVGEVERRVEATEARNRNKVNAYLGQPLVPVPNGTSPIPTNLPPLVSLEMIQALDRETVDKWLEYYTGAAPAAEVGDHAARQALRACTGVELQTF